MNLRLGVGVVLSVLVVAGCSNELGAMSIDDLMGSPFGQRCDYYERQSKLMIGLKPHPDVPALCGCIFRWSIRDGKPIYRAEDYGKSIDVPQWSDSCKQGYVPQLRLVEQGIAEYKQKLDSLK